MANLVEQLRAYGGYLDELSPPLPLSGNDRNRSRRRITLVALAVVLVAAVAAVVVVTEADSPGRLTTNAPNSSQAVSTIAAIATSSVTVAAPEDAIVAENPTIDQQIARLESWYKNSPADALGGRPLLAAEYMFCDLGTTNTAVPVRGTFASNFPLGQPLTEARMAEACARSDSPDARPQPGAAFTLCSTTMRGPRYDLSGTATVPVTRPILLYGAGSCATAGYTPAAVGLLERINALRNIEINMRAVPRDCATEQEATAWVHKVTRDQLGQEWTFGSLASSSIPAAGCYRPHLVELETHQVHFVARPRS